MLPTINRQQLSLMRPDVEMLACDRWRRKQRPRLEIEREDFLPGIRIDRVKHRRIRCGKVERAAFNRRRAYHPRAVVVVAPALFARGGIERIEIRIAAAEV